MHKNLTRFTLYDLPNTCFNYWITQMGWYEQSYFPNILLKKNVKCHSNVLTLLLIFNQQCTFRESSVRRKRQSLTALRDYISGKKNITSSARKKNCAIGAICDCRLFMTLVLKFLLQIKTKLGFWIIDEHRKVNGNEYEILKTCE